MPENKHPYTFTLCHIDCDGRGPTANTVTLTAQGKLSAPKSKCTIIFKSKCTIISKTEHKENTLVWDLDTLQIIAKLVTARHEGTQYPKGEKEIFTAFEMQQSR